MASGKQRMACALSAGLQLQNRFIALVPGKCLHNKPLDLVKSEPHVSTGRKR